MQSFKTNVIWSTLDRFMVEGVIGVWLGTLNRSTQINYHSGMKQLAQQGLINLRISLQAFSFVNHEAILDQIKLVQDWSEDTRQTRAACYVSFTDYLNRQLQGVVLKAIQSKEKETKRFSKYRKKMVTEAMNQAHWRLFYGRQAITTDHFSYFLQSSIAHLL
ncbi:hypothetical protein [Candidatus Protochlamydia amoebophila]|uniref:hypothetical protein n=1 Tax=Candidatus Protochlamydia amoebophila TaxID=362787 RepID=UPI000035345E|nr:hypothetical protein [Candidatus Protochlamydia amoebophila]